MGELSQLPDGDDNPLNRVTDPDFDVRTTAIPIRLFFRTVGALVDELKVVVGERETAEYHDDSMVNGIHARAVDPANVAFVDVTLPAKGGGFGRFDMDDAGHTLGVNVDSLLGTLNFARMSGKGVEDDGDPVALRYDSDLRRLEVTTTRSSQRTQRISQLNLIDPDAIRQEPDLPTLDLPNKGLPESPRAIKDGVDELNKVSDYVRVRADPDVDDAFQFYTEGDAVMKSDFVRFLDSYEVEDGGERGQSSMFSVDYLKDIARGLKRGHMDKVTVHWGDEFPAVFQFFEETYGIRGVYMVAPRIKSD